ncbi:tetratricopeptide repeat protein [Dyadobacter sp. 32]|uniref:tetratricopeptide repeat protein n=1 Tax=Dyadobacter sp. 32 TaxID=538966 RepID=UPI0039C6043D
MDCNSKIVQDSLLEVYVERAGLYGFNDEHWDLTLDSLLRICPGIARVYHEKSIPYLYNGDFSTAFDFVNKAVEIDKKGWLAYRGYLHCIFTRNYERALVDLTEAQTLEPYAHTMDHTYFFYFGLCHLGTGQYERAEQEFLKDIAQQGRGSGHNDIHFNSLFYLGIVYYEMKDFDKSARYFRDCLQLYEQFPEANYYLGSVLKILGSPAAAGYFERAREFYMEGYEMNEPNLSFINFPRQISRADLDRMP